MADGRVLIAIDDERRAGRCPARDRRVNFW
jgi:hypothetical protein